MKLINADKVIEKLKEHKSLFCKNRDEFRALSDKDKARVDEIDTCIAELVNAEEVPHAQLGTNLASLGTDTISRQAAIDCVMECYDNDELFEVYEDRLNELPPAQPERIKGHWIKISPANIYECSECGKSVMTNDICAYDFCHGCGAEMEVTT